MHHTLALVTIAPVPWHGRHTAEYISGRPVEDDPDDDEEAGEVPRLKL